MKCNIQATARCSLFKEECYANSLVRSVFIATCWLQHLIGFFFTSESSSAISATNTGCAGHFAPILVAQKGGSIKPHIVTFNFLGDMPRNAMSAGFDPLGTYFHCSIVARVCNNSTRLATNGRKRVDALQKYRKQPKHRSKNTL